MDNELKMADHIQYTSKKCYAALRNIYKIRRFITVDATKQLVHACVISNIDYCNVLLYGLPSNILSKLQRILNSCARVIYLLPKRTSVTPYLEKLHWLPIKQRICYSVVLNTFKSLKNESPPYLSEMLRPYLPGRQLRSSDAKKLEEPNWNYKAYGFRAFSTAGPREWNRLPQYLRDIDNLNDFKRQLKTYYFKIAYYSETP